MVICESKLKYFCAKCFNSERVPNDSRMISAIILKGILIHYDIDFKEVSLRSIWLNYEESYLKMWSKLDEEIETISGDEKIKKMILRGVEPVDEGDVRDSMMISRFGEIYENQRFCGKEIVTSIAPESNDVLFEGEEMKKLVGCVRKTNSEYLEKYN